MLLRRSDERTRTKSTRGRSVLRAALWAAPAVVAYLGLIPLAAVELDRRIGLGPLPPWSRWPGAVLLPAGLGVALWTFWLFAAVGGGTPNPLVPPERLVVEGPYRWSRNPMMVGGWLAGIGLAGLLRSPSLLGALALVVAAGIVYVRILEEPRLRQRFGAAYERYQEETPRWLGRPRSGGR